MNWVSRDSIFISVQEGKSKLGLAQLIGFPAIHGIIQFYVWLLKWKVQLYCQNYITSITDLLDTGGSSFHSEHWWRHWSEPDHPQRVQRCRRHVQLLRPGRALPVLFGQHPAPLLLPPALQRSDRQRSDLSDEPEHAERSGWTQQNQTDLQRGQIVNQTWTTIIRSGTYLLQQETQFQRKNAIKILCVANRHKNFKKLISNCNDCWSFQNNYQLCNHVCV